MLFRYERHKRGTLRHVFYVSSYACRQRGLDPHAIIGVAGGWCHEQFGPPDSKAWHCGMISIQIADDSHAFAFRMRWC